jgi:hypothetical protein
MSKNKDDKRSGGVYFEGHTNVAGDVVGGDQTKSEFKTKIAGSVKGQVHTGKGNIQIGDGEFSSDASLDTLISALQKFMKDNAPLERRSDAMKRVKQLRESLIEDNPDLELLESTARWFRDRLPSLKNVVFAVIFHPSVNRIIERQGRETYIDFQRRMNVLINTGDNK